MGIWSLHPKVGVGVIVPGTAKATGIGGKRGRFYAAPDGFREVRGSPPARLSSAFPQISIVDLQKKTGPLRSSSGSSGQSPPEEENGPDEVDSDSDDVQSQERANNIHRGSKKFDHTPRDWRTFRANLVAQEQQVQLLDEEEARQQGTHSSKLLGPKWAHPIPSPEAGCVLLATEKLDDTRSFEGTVVLLLRVGSKDPKEGPFGVVINRPLRKTIRDMKPSNPKLATTFADCSLHFGGPLHTSMFLLTSGHKLLPGFEPVIPGLCFGARNNLDEAAELVKKGVLKPQDFRFFIGYSGWQLDQLMEEIELNYWYVAACSANLITGPSDSLSGLWEEILHLMGGHYSELSRKRRQDNS